MTLSVVVADATADRSAAQRCAAAIAGELRDHDEVVWLHRPGTTPPSDVRPVEVAGGRRGRFYGAGLRRANGELVAFTDSVTEVGPGWRAAAVAALGAGAVAVGGPVLPGPGRSPRSLAGFLVEYGPHAAPPFTSATRDVAANNVAYERALLADVVGRDEELWKTQVDAELARRRCPLVVAEEMRVTSLKEYGWRQLGPDRAAHGRLYGAQRSRSWRTGRRTAMAAASVALPLLALARIARVAGRDPALRSAALPSAPFVLVGLVAWSIGEAAGYVLGDAGEAEVF